MTLKLKIKFFILCLFFIKLSYPLISTELYDIILEPLPSWVSLKGFEGERYAFNIRVLAKKENISLRDALEIQNIYLDLTSENKKLNAEQRFQKALKTVKIDGKYEDVWNKDKVNNAKFIIVFDWDDTLLSQYYTYGIRDAKYRDIKLQEDCLSKYAKHGSKNCANCIKFTPGWKDILKGVKSLGGAIIFFTAKNDFRAHQILSRWKLDNKPITEFIDGMLTKNHLTLVPGKAYERGRAYPMKDMQLIDPSLKRIILIDDSPSKTYQPYNVVPITRFQPDIYFNKQTPDKIKKMYENTLRDIMVEIRDSLEYSEKHGISFVEAFKPYSLIGRYSLYNLIDNGLSKKEAADILRKNSDIIENRF